MQALKNYFDRYFFSPCNWRLTSTQKALCVISTVCLTVLSGGLIPLAVCIYKLVEHIRPISISIPTSHFHDVHRRIMNTSKKVLELSSSPAAMGELTRSNFAEIIQNRVLAPFYRKKLPPKEELLVPVIAEMKLTTDQTQKIVQKGASSFIHFVDLTKEQKIALNNRLGREHNQLKGSASDQEVDHAFFTVHGQAEFLPNDPKGGHGCDHALRVAILAPIFAYLYQKYHPDVNISEKEMLVSELVASLHDSGRSAEGTDVYDELSAENALSTLQDLGITEERWLQDARFAIADKDHNPLDTKTPKPVIARIVQNVDSADFTRITLKSEKQPSYSFHHSKGFLDIYKELNALSSGDTNYVLKDGLTFGNFLEELEVLLEEKNKLAFRTHHKEFREKASDPTKNYYQELLSLVAFEEYPNMNHVLSLLNVNKSDSKLHPYMEIAKHHLKELTPVEIEQKIGELKAYPPSLMRDELLARFEKGRAPVQKEAKAPETTIAALITAPASIPSDKPLFIHSDADSIRKRQLRLQQKEFDDGRRIIETSFEFTRAAREAFDKQIEKLKERPPEGVKVYEASLRFSKKEANGKFSTTNSLDAGPSIVFEKDGISFEVGRDISRYNLWSFAMCRAPIPTDPAKIEELFRLIGLSSLLAHSGLDDIRRENFNKVIQFRFPEKVFANWPRVSQEEIYNALSEEEKAIVDADMKKMQLKESAQNYFEYVQPELPAELYNAGARGFVTNVMAPSESTAAQIVLNIVRTSLLSTVERYSQGILGLGTCPAFNVEHGSANQAFARLVTKGFLDKKYDFRDLSYSGGSKIFIFYDLKAAERMPYAYPFDCAGMRNPFFRTRSFKIHGYKTITDAKGYEMQRYRKTVAELAKHIDSVDDPISQGNEVMFDRALGSDYISCIMVPAKMRAGIIELLKTYGIETLNGKPIEERIVELGSVSPNTFKEAKA